MHKKFKWLITQDTVDKALNLFSDYQDGEFRAKQLVMETVVFAHQMGIETALKSLPRPEDFAMLFAMLPFPVYVSRDKALQVCDCVKSIMQDMQNNEILAQEVNDND